MKHFLCYFLFFTLGVFSQEKTSLKNALFQLSTKYKIQFSYKDSSVEKFKNISFNNSQSIDSILLSLSLQTQLVFEKIDNKNYVIRFLNTKKKSICAYVVSSKKHTKLPFVTVYYNAQNKYTNASGFFKIKNVISDGFITLSSVGYQSKTIAINTFTKECNIIVLEEEINYLNKIVITDYLTKGFLKKKDGSITLNSKKMGILPGVIEPDVLQSLQLIPGVHSPNETASGIHIRGSTPDQNLVIFDGMKMYHFSHFFGFISVFNPYITNQVKLYRSGTHAKYGNNVGGVLDISVDNPSLQKTTIGFGTTFTHSDFFIKTPLFKDKVGIVFSARRSITDFINSITYQKYSEVAFQNSKISEGLDDESLKIVNAKNNFYYEDYHTKVMVQPSQNSKISFSYLYNLNDLNFTGNTPNINQNFEDDIRIKNQGFRIDWKQGLLKNGIHQIGFTSTNFDKNYQGFRDRTLRNGNSEIANYGKENGVKEHSFEYLFEKLTTKNNSWQLGYQFHKYHVNYLFYREIPGDSNTINDLIDEQANSSAFFTEYQYNNKHNWLLNLGIRLQRFNKPSKSYLEPRLNVNYKLNKSLNVSFSTEVKHQSISQVVDFREDGLGGVFDRFWTLSNTQTFPVLKNTQISFGANYQKNNWTFDLEFYQKNIEGIVLLIDENIKSEKYYSGTNIVYGIDFLIKKQWNNYNTWVSYTWSNSQYQFKNLNNSNKFDGSYDIPHNFIWSHTYSKNKMQYSLGWRFRSGLPYTVKTAVQNKKNEGLKINFEDLNTERLSNYQRIDFSTAYKFYIGKKKKYNGVLGLTLQNLLNKRNILSKDYEIQTVIIEQGTSREEKQVLVETNSLSMGFVPNVMFRVNF
ncbi:hypothetical protein FHR24_000302 [Wenyingzhuangia heitensis]|uniref:Outer membrane receptor proteins, mostly Fe transport n=1 Tax=Wenyingzhuangia heitensis TaxID=1487859 RepID=A0ABX0U6Q0_9FLAO|nr:TonB-dependent receptor [Wenyingzhuangia heitensis]NIJ43863.1 hypothetical protein [Wenyingzhuangia heitensis]